MRNIKLLLEYDGTNYCGWQRQNNAVSIQEMLEKAIYEITRQKSELIGASRTDAGVHARGMVANFHTSSGIPAEKFPTALNSKLPKDIVVLKAEEADYDFHSRYSAKGKKYSYCILNRQMPSAILDRFSMHCPYALDFESMEKASEYFIGIHDFTAFKSTGSSVKTSIRTISSLELVKVDECIIMYIQADGFLYNMVRIIAGTLIDVGKGKTAPDQIKDIIEGRDRKMAGQTASAKGLCLEEVYY